MQNLIKNLKNSFKNDTLEDLANAIYDIQIYLDKNFDQQKGEFLEFHSKEYNEFLVKLKELAEEYIENNKDNGRFPYTISKNIIEILEDAKFQLSDEDLEGYLINILLLVEDIAYEISSINRTETEDYTPSEN